MKTAFTSWKLAKGIYIIPVIMAYHPLLLNGPPWEVAKTVVFSLFSITAFVACMERYFLTRLSWAETLLQGAAAVLLIWADPGLNYMGFALFLVLMIVQIWIKKEGAMPGRFISSGERRYWERRLSCRKWRLRTTPDRWGPVSCRKAYPKARDPQVMAPG